MDIKNLKPNPNSKYKQGYFDRFNPVKYVGERPIIYRSSLELIFMRKMEANSSVEFWSSEQIVIPYIMMEKIKGKFVQTRHNYHTDFTVWLKTKIKYVVEVKPSQLTPLNEAQIHRNPVMYKNACKWRAAISWCKQNNCSFKIVTEAHLKNKVF